jgi:hypothetical protein
LAFADHRLRNAIILRSRPTHVVGRRGASNRSDRTARRSAL